MTTNLPIQTNEVREQMEKRRFEAIPLFEAGMKRTQVAEKLGVSRTTVHRWLKAWKGGSDLKSRKATGRPVLVANVIGVIQNLLREHPDMTANELREWIWTSFQISYNIDHVYRLRRKILDRIGQ